ncbi:DUF29 domain-containing protein [Gloeobacter violaceus]|uniref:DUF29 domain-containing protein n=1 Tax=Gloeobacter violaceus TaxID=33072 RepID=UPI000314B652|nr:DUF29 domain-containing protein [Gloeobacter violaceus]
MDTETRERVGYDEDFHAWAFAQATLLREGRLDRLDLENLAEELESLGRSERRALESRLEVLILHLLKWQYQAEKRSKSWLATIAEQRYRISRLFHESPSLRPLLEELVPVAFIGATFSFERETELPRSLVGKSCPYSTTQIVDDAFLPQETGGPPIEPQSL